MNNNTRVWVLRNDRWTNIHVLDLNANVRREIQTSIIEGAKEGTVGVCGKLYKWELKQENK